MLTWIKKKLMLTSEAFRLIPIVFPLAVGVASNAVAAAGVASNAVAAVVYPVMLMLLWCSQ